MSFINSSYLISWVPFDPSILSRGAPFAHFYILQQLGGVYNIFTKKTSMTVFIFSKDKSLILGKY